MQIVFLGPLPPLQGGIARHSGEVVQALSAISGVDVRTITFARLFPRLLYPGSMPVDATDPDGVLDSIDPRTWLTVARDLERSPPRLLVIPAWTFFVAPVMGFIARKARKAGIKVAMIAHNVGDHEGAEWKSRLMRLQLASADCFVVHSAHLQSELRRLFPAKPSALVPHPPYGNFPETGEKYPRRAKLELLFFGYVRQYKGLDILLDAIELVPDIDLKLTVAGEVWSEGTTLRDRIASPPLAGRIELLDRYVDDAEIAPLFRRCDALVVPYRKATGSGVIAVAQNFGTRVIASKVDGLAEAVSTEDGDLLVAPDNPAALARAIAEAASSPFAASRKQPCADAWRAYATALLHLALGDDASPCAGTGDIANG